MTRCLFGLALIAFLHTGGGCSPPPDEPGRPYAVGLYAGEDRSYPDIEASLSHLADKRLSLMLAVPEASLSTPALKQELTALLAEAERRGVEVRLWPLLDQSDGYWPNETNLDRFSKYVHRLLDWIEGEGLKVSTVIYDMEPAWDFAHQLKQAFDVGIGEAVKLLRLHLDPVRHASARARLVQQVTAIQARDVRVQCVTFPQVLDDLSDGDHDLQDAFDIPVVGVPWDEVSFMVYQSVYFMTLGVWVGPSLIRTYAEVASMHFDGRATIALGVVGRAGVMTEEAHLYPDPAALRDDVAAALAEGINRLEIFSLDGMLGSTEHPLDTWLAATDAGPRRPLETFNSKLARQAFLSLDSLLEQ